MIHTQSWRLRTLYWSLVTYLSHASLDLYDCPAPRSLPMEFPERSCMRCSKVPKLETLPYQADYKQTGIYFQNQMVDEAAELRWVDASGIEHVAGLLEPGFRVGFMTEEGHVHRAYSTKDGSLLVEHMAGRRPLGSDSSIDMKSLAPYKNDSATGSEFRESESGKRTPGYPNYGFVNTLSVPVQLFWRGEGEERQVYELAAGETYFEGTHQNHEWVVRAQDGQLVTEFAVADVAITKCSPDDPAEVSSEMAKERLTSTIGEPVTIRTCPLNIMDAGVGCMKTATANSYTM